MALALLNIGPIEILLVLGAAVLLFGGDLPETARKLGTFMARARSAANDIRRTVYESEAEEQATRRLPPAREPTIHQAKTIDAGDDENGAEDDARDVAAPDGRAAPPRD